MNISEIKIGERLRNREHPFITVAVAANNSDAMRPHLLVRFVDSEAIGMGYSDGSIPAALLNKWERV